MALAHMERRLMVQFTKFHLQSKNWLEKVGWVSWQVILIRKFFFPVEERSIFSPNISLFWAKRQFVFWDASIEKFCKKWRHSFQFCTNNREKDAMDEMRVEQALQILLHLVFNSKFLFTSISTGDRGIKLDYSMQKFALFLGIWKLSITFAQYAINKLFEHSKIN